MVIGSKITELRKKYNYTQEQLAEKVGISRQTLSNWESNITSPDLNQASILCKELKIEINDLLDNDVLIDVQDNTNYMLNKLINKEVNITFVDEYYDIDITKKVKILNINGKFIKVEILNKKKSIIKLIDIDLIESIKLEEE